MTLCAHRPAAYIVLASQLLLGSLPGHGQGLKEFPLSSEWQAKIRAIAPRTPRASPQQDRQILVFSLTTGFKHWCIPHTDAVVEILGETSGAYQTVKSTDIEVFLPDSIQRFDAIVLNNNCPGREDRDLFRDVLVRKMDDFGAKYKDLPASEREALANKLYRSLVSFVGSGGGLVLLHGAISNFNYSDEFSDLAGGSFAFHPPQQEVTLVPVTPDHPMLKHFGGKPFVHVDEPYIFNRAYAKFNFHALLELQTDQLKGHRKLHEIQKLPRYVAWIKPYQQGRVFFCSPSHNAQSFEHPQLLQFILNGVQYALGDLKCEDTPNGKPGGTSE